MFKIQCYNRCCSAYQGTQWNAECICLFTLNTKNPPSCPQNLSLSWGISNLRTSQSLLNLTQESEHSSACLRLETPVEGSPNESSAAARDLTLDNCSVCNKQPGGTGSVSPPPRVGRRLHLESSWELSVLVPGDNTALPAAASQQHFENAQFWKTVKQFPSLEGKQF